ncbi:MAG: AAA family ATPase [Agrococcus casei]|uniref:AAA family ATPase n=1 Tax=Agrococcus casei TaxID=343512 RepID=UPI003F92E08A
MLHSDDVLPSPPQRVLIAGVTGSGKTTLASRLAPLWHLEHYEIDALFHGPGWTPRPEFLDEVRAFAATERWVTEWQYTSKGTNDILPPRADLAIWLDYPYRVVRQRLLRRTLRRSILRTKLWNGNVEPPPWTQLSATKEESIMRWQTATLTKWRERMPDLEQSFPSMQVVRLGHPRELEHWLQRQPTAS